MRLEQFYYLVEINKTRSMSLAAENLFVTQPTLSIAISNLEKELGVKLWERTKSGVYPTPQGEMAIQLAQEIIEKIDIFSSINTPSTSQNEINIFTIPAINCGFLQYALIDFTTTHPDVYVHIREENLPIAFSSFMREYLKKATRYLGIFHIPAKLLKKQEEFFQKNNLMVEPLLHDEMVCIMNHTHPLSQLETLTLQDCEKHPLVQFQLNFDSNNDFFRDELSTIDITDELNSLYTKKDVLFSVPTLTNLLRIISNTSNIAIMPSALLYNDPAYLNGDILMRRFFNVPMPLSYYLIYPSDLPLSKNELDFITTLRSNISKVTGHLALSPFTL